MSPPKPLHDHKYLLDSKVVSETLRVRVHPRHREVGGSGGVEGGALLKIKLKISISESSRNLGGVERGSLLKINNLTRSKFHFQNVLQIWKGTTFLYLPVDYRKAEVNTTLPGTGKDK